MTLLSEIEVSNSIRPEHG